jgi:hypothetical protein
LNSYYGMIATDIYKSICARHPYYQITNPYYKKCVMLKLSTDKIFIKSTETDFNGRWSWKSSENASNSSAMKCEKSFQCFLNKCTKRFDYKGDMEKHIKNYHPGHSQDLTPVPLQENKLINLQNQATTFTPNSTVVVVKAHTGLVAMTNHSNKRAFSQIKCQVPSSKKPKEAESFEKEPKKCSKEIVINSSCLEARLSYGNSTQLSPNKRALSQIQRSLPYRCLQKTCLKRFPNKRNLSKHIELYHLGHSQDLRPMPLQEDELINLQNQTSTSTPSSTKVVVKSSANLETTTMRTKSPLTTSIASAIPQATMFISNNTRTSTSSNGHEGSENNSFLPLIQRHPVQHEELVASGFPKYLGTNDVVEKEVVFKVSTRLEATTTTTKGWHTTSIASDIPKATVVISNNTKASTSASSSEGSENKFLSLQPIHPVPLEELVASGFSKI